MVVSISTSTRIYDVFKPIFILTRICGFLPIRVTKTSLDTSVTWSQKYYILSLTGVVLFVTWIVFGLSKSYGIEDVYNIRLKEFSGMFITILDDTYLISTFVLATCITPVTFKHFCRYLTCLNKVDGLLKRQHDSEKSKCTVVFILTIILTVVVLAIDLTIWAKVVLNHLSGFVYLLYNIPFYCTYFLVMVIEINYWYLVYMLNVRLKYLNENLADTYVQYQLKVTNRSLKQKRSKSDVGNNVYILNGPVAAKSGNQTETDVNFVKVYELLFEASCAVNAFYGINILLVLIGCLIHLLVTPYDLYLELKFEDYTFVFPQLCWMTSHILRLLLVVEPCHVATQEVKAAASVVCKFLVLDLSEDLRRQFDILAIQLLHCPIEFTACDLIVLNRSLLTAIAGSVTTYLVILFQFENH